MNQKQYGKSNPKPPYKNKFTQKPGIDKKKPKVIKISTPKVPKDWLYMCSKEVGVEVIAAAIGEMNNIEVEVWKEMGILEMTMGEESRMDFERIETDLGDEYSNAFLQEHEVAALYAVSVKDVAQELVTEVMKKICVEVGGFFCGDTDDFEPIIKA